MRVAVRRIADGRRMEHLAGQAHYEHARDARGRLHTVATVLSSAHGAAGLTTVAELLVRRPVLAGTRLRSCATAGWLPRPWPRVAPLTPTSRGSWRRPGRPRRGRACRDVTTPRR
jgi:hypothetical protein